MSVRLKVAIYHNLHSGGAKRTFCAITDRLSRRHDVDLFTLSCSDHAFGDEGVHVRARHTTPFTPLPTLDRPLGRLNPAARLLDLRRLDRVQEEVAGLIDRGGYDVVYVHPCQFTQTPALLTRVRTPSLYHPRESLRVAYESPVERPYRRSHGLGRWLDRIDPIGNAFERARTAVDRAGMRAASRVITNSHFTREAISRIYGVDAAVCYHGVDSEQFRPLGLARTGGVVSVGALSPNKGFDFLIQSLARIDASRRPSLTVVSNYQESREKTFLEALAASLDVRLELRQLVSDAALVALYNAACLVAYAPVREPFGLVPLEAMACGTAIVAVKEGGVQESVRHEETGLLVERDPRVCAAAIESLLSDPERTSAYGRTGREVVLRDWTWDAAIARLETHLRAVA